MDYNRFWLPPDSGLFWTGADAGLFWGDVAIAMPTNVGTAKARFLLRGNTQLFESPLSRSTQTLELTGARWEATFELPAMNRAEAAVWIAWLTEQLGMAGRFFAGDPSMKTPRGVATGAPVVGAVSQAGRILATAGWTPDITGILKAGDFFSYNTPTMWRQMHQVITDADSDSGGIAVLEIVPSMRESPPINTPITVSSPTCIMRLATDEMPAWDIESALIYGISFSGIEVFK